MITTTKYAPTNPTIVKHTYLIQASESQNATFFGPISARIDSSMRSFNEYTTNGILEGISFKLLNYQIQGGNLSVADVQSYVTLQYDPTLLQPLTQNLPSTSNNSVMLIPLQRSNANNGNYTQYGSNGPEIYFRPVGPFSSIVNSFIRVLIRSANTNLVLSPIDEALWTLEYSEYISQL